MVLKRRQLFKESQLRAIMKYRVRLEKLYKRSIPLAEAIINWIALGYAEDYRSIYFLQED